MRVFVLNYFERPKWSFGKKKYMRKCAWRRRIFSSALNKIYDKHTKCHYQPAATIHRLTIVTSHRPFDSHHLSADRHPTSTTRRPTTANQASCHQPSNHRHKHFFIFLRFKKNGDMDFSRI